MIYNDLAERVKHFFANINQSSSYCKIGRRWSGRKWRVCSIQPWYIDTLLYSVLTETLKGESTPETRREAEDCKRAGAE